MTATARPWYIGQTDNATPYIRAHGEYNDEEKVIVHISDIYENNTENAILIVRAVNIAEAKDKRIVELEEACKLAKTAISDKNRQERIDRGNLIAQSIESLRGMSAEDQIEKAFFKLQDVLANKGASNATYNNK